MSFPTSPDAHKGILLLSCAVLDAESYSTIEFDARPVEKRVNTQVILASLDIGKMFCFNSDEDREVLLWFELDEKIACQRAPADLRQSFSIVVNSLVLEWAYTYFRGYKVWQSYV
jgi:hypothetical protein